MWGGMEGNENTMRLFPIAVGGHMSDGCSTTYKEIEITKASAGSSLDDFFRCLMGDISEKRKVAPEQL